MTQDDSQNSNVSATGGFIAVDMATLRYANADDTLVELSAVDLADVLQGLSELVSDFAKAGVFGDGPTPRVMVRPPQEGSFSIDALLEVMQQHVQLGNVVVGGGLFSGITGLVKWATKSARAEIADVDPYGPGKIKVKWQDGTADVVDERIFEELQKLKRKNKKALRKLLAPMGDEATSLTVTDMDGEVEAEPMQIELTRDDYRAVLPEPREPEDEVNTFPAEARIVTANLQGPDGWRISTIEGERRVTIEDEDFLAEVRDGRPIRADEILWVYVREEVTVPNERRRTKWTITDVLQSRLEAHAEEEEAETERP